MTQVEFATETSPHWSAEGYINALFLRTNQNYANDLLRARGHVFLNEVHDLLGLPRTKQGQLEGWTYSSQDRDHIDFGCWDQDYESGSLTLTFNVEGNILDKVFSS